MIKNTGILKLTLNKKHNLNNYHIVCKSVATKMMRIAKKIWIDIADAFTKLVHTDRLHAFVISHWEFLS